MFKAVSLKIFTVTLFVLLFTAFAAAQGTAQEAERKPADRPLRVTYNPSGEYTSEARAKQLSGWIKLRVTFLDTGELGDIFYVDESTPDKSLSKAGLLKSAYDAAKKIRFEPAIKDGSPVTVTKVLAYDFQIGERPGFRVGRRP
jgi:outer membrane biosynthesis protein TonB